MTPTRRQPLTAARPAQEAQDGPQIISLGIEALEPSEAMSGHQAEAPARPSFSLSEAAKLTGRNRRTLRRWLDAGRFPGAFQDDTDLHTWRIPAADLGTAGLGTTPPDGARGGTTGPMPLAFGEGVTGADLAARLRDLERQLADERTARKVAEAIATERATQLDDLRGALEVLSRGQLPPPASSPTTERRSWWRR
jgi:hypothetical protein